MDPSRRNFFRGRIQAAEKVLRPPLAAKTFTDACSRCGDCLRACPGHIIVADPDGFPYIDFERGECTFCNQCSTACKTGALQPLDAEHVWPHRVQISDQCLTRRGIECRSCGDFCATGAIRFRPSPGGIARLEIEAGCNGCGACVAPCPVKAVAVR